MIYGSIKVVYSVPFRSCQNGWKILYQYANQYEITLHSTSNKISDISVHFARFGEFQVISASMCSSAGLFFSLLSFFSAPSSSSFFFPPSSLSVSIPFLYFFFFFVFLVQVSWPVPLLSFFFFFLFFYPALSLSLYLWWTARRTVVTLQLAMKNQNSFQSTFIYMVI